MQLLILVNTMRQHWEKGDSDYSAPALLPPGFVCLTQPFCANYTYNIFQMGFLTKMFSDGWSQYKIHICTRGLCFTSPPGVSSLKVGH